jgi:hypothetical protein
MTHGSPAIRFRLATEVFPGLLEPDALQSLRLELEEQPQVKQIARKQKETGVWGGNLLGVTPNKATGVKDVGTIPQFRRLVELGVGKDSRPNKMAARVLFRLVSRDEDPKLLFEYGKLGAAELDAEPWIREILREAATAALAHAGHGDDPRVRGAAHKILNQVSAFVRSELAENPFAKSGRAWVLHPQAHPPTIFSISLLASLPAVQRERAGLVERLGQEGLHGPDRQEVHQAELPAAGRSAAPLGLRTAGRPAVRAVLAGTARPTRRSVVLGVGSEGVEPIVEGHRQGRRLASQGTSRASQGGVAVGVSHVPASRGLEDRGIQADGRDVQDGADRPYRRDGVDGDLS